MQDYQVYSYVKQINSHIDWLALPLSAPACIIEASHRKALHGDILNSIRDLDDLGVIDFAEKEQLLIRLANAYIYGGL